MAHGLPYWIEEFSGNFTIWIKTDIPANSTKLIYILKEEGYTPSTEIFDFFDHFDDPTLPNWDTTLARGDWLVEESKLKMHSDWGSCCNTSCYYNGLATTFNLTRPFAVDAVFQQIPFTPTTGCGRTGPSFEHLNQAVVTTSASTGGEAFHMRLGDDIVVFEDSILDAPNRMSVEFFETKVVANGNFLAATREVESATGTNDPAPFCMAGDTDMSSVRDEVDYLFIRKTADPFPTVNVFQIAEGVYRIEITNNGSTDLTDFQIPIPGNDIVTTTDDSLNVADTIVKLLFYKREDGNVYTWDGSNWVYVTDKASLDTSHFDNYGMENPVTIDKTTLLSLSSNPVVLTYPPEESPSSVTLRLTVIPHAQLIVPNTVKSLAGSSSFTVQATFSGNGLAKVLVTRDGTNYYTWDADAGQWAPVFSSPPDPTNESDITTVLNDGITIDDLNTFTWDTHWKHLFPDQVPDAIAFAIAIQYPTWSDDFNVDEIKLMIIPDSDSYVIDQSHTVEQLESAIIITFSAPGTYKINYID